MTDLKAQFTAEEALTYEVHRIRRAVENYVRDGSRERVVVHREAEHTSQRSLFALSAPITLNEAAAMCGYAPDAIHTDAARAEIFEMWAKLRFEYADVMLKAARAKEG